jgi:phenylalanyl-tRNA synthetase beta chain
MKISYNWLQRYISPAPSIEETSRLLTASGLEVEGIEHFESHKGGLKGLVVGEVKTCIQHPNADRLRLTTVDIGAADLLHIVCGAPNVATGQKVIVATIGTTLYPVSGESFVIKESKIRGELSQGMLCAEDEIGIGESHAGILVLPAETPVGKAVAELYDVVEDQVLEIG